MAVKDGLPATDFSRQNREWVRNVAEGESVPDGLPATDFSRMNREWVKAVAGGGGGGGSITVEPLTVTENDTYTAPEGKAYSPVTVNVSGGGSEFQHFTMTVNATFPEDSYLWALYTAFGSEVPVNALFSFDEDWRAFYEFFIDSPENLTTINLLLLSGNSMILHVEGENISVSGNAVYNSEDNEIEVTGDFTLNITAYEP